VFIARWNRADRGQYLNPATLDVEVDGETVPVKGWLFNEASFVSE
jgi:hypothetical protein